MSFLKKLRDHKKAQMNKGSCDFTYYYTAAQIPEIHQAISDTRLSGVLYYQEQQMETLLGCKLVPIEDKHD